MSFLDLCGWVRDDDEVSRLLAMQPHPNFKAACVTFGIEGIGAGKKVCLYEYSYKVLGGQDKFNTRHQTIGDCVSMGSAACIDQLNCIQVAARKSTWIAETATEAIYALSRIEIGKGRLGNGDGSVGAWAVEACKQYGTLIRVKYGNIDLTVYSGKRAGEWGAPGRGLPDELEPEAHKHIIRTYSQVSTFEQARDAIAAGYPVSVASNQGFTNQRDQDGFLRPSGSWGHQMMFNAVDDEFKRPGLCCLNSWGTDWVSGPTRNNQPGGSFWVDADVATRMLSQGDSFAYSDFEGFPPKLQNLAEIF